MGLLIGTKEGTQSLVKTTSYELNEGDHKNIVVFNTLTDVVCTIPQGLRVGFVCNIVQKGAGKVSFTTPNIAGGKVNGGTTTIKTKGAWANARVLCTATNEYTVDFSGASDGGIGGGGSLPPAVNEGTRLVSGSVSWAGTGLFFDVTNCMYFINGVAKNSLATQVQLAAANNVNSRIDVIFVDVNNTVGVLTGTPAASPVKPQVNIATQVEVTFVLIATNALTPSGIIDEVIYDENIEWSHSSATNINFNYLLDFKRGTKSIMVAPIAGEQYFTLQKNSILKISDYEFLKMYVKINGPLNVLSAAFPFIGVGFSLNTGVTGFSTFQITASHGLNIGLVDQWQLITVPLSQIGFTSQNFNQVYFKTSLGDNSVSLDYIVLQGSGPIVAAPANIIYSQLGNPFRIEIFEDEDGTGYIQNTRI